MGLTYPQIQALLSAREQGKSFERTLTVGRQKIYLHPGEADRLPIAPPSFGDYADDFLRALLGIRDLQSVDASDFEGATIIHDLNSALDIDQEFHAVIDAGSLEHIFNVPVALASYMRALKVGGTLFISTPANNLCGHGFYQFSPEWVFRALSEPHGFAIRRTLLAVYRYPGIELAPAMRTVRVVDPAEVGSRVVLLSRRPVMMDVLAEKCQHLHDPFASPPQQSDYVVRWTGRTGPTGVWRRAAKSLPKRLIGMRQRARSSLWNRRFYRRVDL
jgi:SAM-dependent methyltransferase